MEPQLPTLRQRRFARRRLAIIPVAAALLAILFPGADRTAQAETKPVLVAAASDLRYAIEEIAGLYEARAGVAVKVSYGSSGNFARQIQQGAPFAIFLSADEEYVFRLADAGLAGDSGIPYALGRIVIFVPAGSPLKADGSLDDLAAALADGRVKRFAIANPDHAPYGKRAEEALRHKGVWDTIRPRLVLGENVSQAAQFAASKSAQGGIVAYSLALAPRLAALGSYALIPAGWHSPLRQRMVLMRNATREDEAFFEFLQNDEARAIFRKFGFLLPDQDG